MAALDPEITRLYTTEQLGTRQIAERLGLDKAVVYKRLVRLGLQRGAVAAAKLRRGAPLPVPFDLERRAPREMTGPIAEAKATVWFLEHGYNVSKPAVPAQYDLVIESEAGPQRVQVKATTTLNSSTDNFLVRISRTVYTPESAPQNTHYKRGEVDAFFVIAGEGEHEQFYVIPFDAVEGKLFLVLDNDYAAYRVK